MLPCKIIYLFVFIFKAVSHHRAHSGLELVILQPQSPEFWDYRSGPPHLDVFTQEQL